MNEDYIVTTAPIEDFFTQGRDIARKLDRGEKIARRLHRDRSE